MRPKLKTDLFLLSNSSAHEGSREREMRHVPAEESGLRLALHSDVVPMPPSSRRSLAELDAFLVVRLESLEISLGAHEAVLLGEAFCVRDILAEVSAHADPSTGSTTCDAELIETLRGAYAWMFGALDALFLGECVRPLPRRLAAELLDHGSVASMRSLLDARLASLEPLVLDLMRACLRLARPR